MADVLALRGVTPHEKLLLLALAEDARRGSRQASPGMDDDRNGRPGLLTRTALGPSTIYAVTAALVAPDRPGGPLLRRVSRGHGTGRAGGARRAVFELLVPAQSASGSQEADPTESASGSQEAEPSQPPRPTESASTDGRVSLLAAGPLPEVPPGTTSLSPREEAGETMHTTTRETGNDGDTFGARTLAALARTDLTARQLDQLRDRAAGRIGQLLACDAAYAVAAMDGVRKPAAYMASLSDDDLRALAEQRRDERERPARRAKPEQRPHCGECSPTRRLEDPEDGRDRGPCPRCHWSSVREAS